MSTRRAKQIIYAAFYLIVWFFVIWAGYSFFIKAPASCFDGKQDGGEQGVDCGGPCAKVCATGIGGTQAITVPLVDSFVSTPGHYTFLAQVANPNSSLAASSFSYDFNFYTASGTLFQSVPGVSFLYASEVKYLLLANVQVPSAFGSASLTISSANWEASSSFGVVPQLSVQGVTTQVGSSTVSVAGQLVDNDTAALNNILVIAIFKDANGNPIGASQTELDGIASGQTENFSIIYPVVAGIDAAATEVEVDALR